MSTANELLRRALRYFKKTDCVNTLAEDIEHFLSTPSDEPVYQLRVDAEQLHTWIDVSASFYERENCAKRILYLHPPNPAEPEADSFCDSHCTWLDHSPECKYAEPEAEPVAWRDHVEARIRGWRRSQMNSDGDRISVSDLMYPEEIDDLVDYVCDEYTRPEPEKTIAKLEAENFALASGQCTEGGPWGDQGGTPYCKYAARKPMTEEEIDKEISTNDDYWLTDLGCFSAGVRFAEKHHGIANEP